MTLRLRLVIALVVLATAGLAVFGISTYGFYSRAQYRELDSQLKESAPLVQRVLLPEADGGARPDQSGPGGGRAPRIPGNVYGELRNVDGAYVVGRLLLDLTNAARPHLPDVLAATSSARFFSTGSVQGSTQWRVYVTRGDFGATIVVATPMNEVTSSLHRLIFIEAAAAALLLAMLAAGSWLIMRRGLRPLEEMATSASSISAGALDQRVAPADGRTEVGQLGLALNTMLSELEDAFGERDATELRLRQFLADASHELRTPLTSIQGFAELFRLDPTGERIDLPVVLRRIEEESARMEKLVAELLLLARLDQTPPAEREPVDLAVLAADACSDAVAMAPDRPVTLDAPEPVMVLGDDDHLRRAIGNLVTNAVRHTPARSALEVTAHDVGGRAVVTVRDHGAGLDPEALQHVFDRFWRADAARVGGGAGLGLSIVAAIAHEHGGTVDAGNAVGGGAVFAISLPLTAATADHPAKNRNAAST